MHAVLNDVGERLGVVDLSNGDVVDGTQDFVDLWEDISNTPVMQYRPADKPTGADSEESAEQTTAGEVGGTELLMTAIDYGLVLVELPE
jgi:hypothetical protein